MEHINADQNFESLKLTLPPAPPLGGIYKPALITGNYLYLSGHGPMLEDKTYITGKVGQDIDQEKAKLAALQTALTILATLKASVGSFNKIKRVIKILGMVNAVPDFEKHPYVINGCSELFAKIWGEENGIGARSAVGMGSLPNNMAVEIEVIFELH
ncbi:RidA family protein [Terrimonas pollutisoli]|uniref:RidA family protein n=1 Tax=Terrimonas pollutisoli TaxID=3034147 RepID=UPI0023EE048A|nr:RidA family protein [Terrimonas sp. H1YJ31]